MTKLVSILGLLFVGMVWFTAEATSLRRRLNGAKGVKKNTVQKQDTRILKKGKYKYKYYEDDDDDDDTGFYDQTDYYSKKGKKGKKAKKKRVVPQCRPVVEGAEFLFEGTLTGLGDPSGGNSFFGNTTDDDFSTTDEIGTTYIYNGPLLEFNEDDELQALNNFFISGSCQRTEEFGGQDFVGSGHCSFTVTLDTGATMNFAGEAFDEWENLMAMNGGSQELIGLSGSVTLIALNEDFEVGEGDFFNAPFMYAEVILVYSVCPEGYWDRYYIADHDELPEGDIADPFTFLAEQN